MNTLTAILPVALLLLLLSSSCTLQNNTLSTQTETIQDAYWILVSLEGQNVQASKDTRTAYIRFEEKDDDVTGYTGCNRISGSYTLTDERLQLSELSTTRMTCADMQLENKMLEVLSRVNTYRVAGDVLTLYDGDKAVATFMTGNVEVMESDLDRNINNDNN
ncbi:META domain-containing protein [Pontibacter pamirensis]|uniref:META domain-containing protein n=1 Tax=Pontibacter pamirensis TaxID=2562824 RepID=UPI00138951FB|nr:META domain-containing protein [Pontibacter pamirensis]